MTNEQNNETVTISRKEYDELVDRDNMLTALENGGVDNWTWYSESLEEYWAEKNKE